MEQTFSVDVSPRISTAEGTLENAGTLATKALNLAIRA
jgi:hypothetical protein